MHRGPEDLPGGAELDDSAGVHDGHVGHEAADDGEVVAHVDGGDAVRDAERAHRLEYVTLRRDVEARRRLVEHDQCRPARKGHGEGDTLLLAARQLVRVATQHGGGGVEAGLRHDLRDALAGVACGARVHLEGLPQLRADTERRVECGGGILRYVGDLGAPHGLEALAVEGEHVDAVEEDGAPADGEPPPGVTEKGVGDGRLAGARLPHEAEHLAGADVEGHLAHDVRPAAAETYLEVAHLEADGSIVAGWCRHGGPGGEGVVAHGTTEALRPMSSTRAAASGRRSTPMATRAMASVKVFVPIVSRAMRVAGTMTDHGLFTGARPS